MKPSEILTKAKALIAKPENWIQGAYASDGNLSIPPDNPMATCFCSLGALQAVLKDQLAVYADTRVYLKAATPDGLVATFNDTHTHAEVMEMWDRAIAKAITEEV